MIPERVNLKAYAGDHFSRVLVFTDGNEDPINVTDWVARSQIRRGHGQSIEASFGIDKAEAVDGKIKISLVPAQTQNLIKDYAWDFEVTGTDGKVRTLLAGKITFLPDITR